VKFRRTRYGYVVRIDTGEDIVATLRDFAKTEGVRSGLISGLGAVGETELGFFVRATGQYITRTFTGEFEIGSLTGNFSELDGEPFPHCHAVIAGEDFVAHTGHLFRGDGHGDVRGAGDHRPGRHAPRAPARPGLQPDRARGRLTRT
jgi:predicted DNA-binding protein with PD1-like motif